MPVSRHPWMGSVTLTAANTNYSLRTLLEALDPSVRPNTEDTTRLAKVQWLAIQLDLGAGGASLVIGNPNNLSATNSGVEILAGQTWSIWSQPTNLIVLDDIQLRSNTAGVRVNITFMRL